MRYSEFIVKPQKPFSLERTSPDLTDEFASETAAQESSARRLI